VLFIADLDELFVSGEREAAPVDANKRSHTPSDSPHGSRPQPFNSIQLSYWYFIVQPRVLSGMQSDQPPCYTRVGVRRRSSFGRVGCGYIFSRSMGPGPSVFSPSPPPLVFLQGTLGNGFRLIQVSPTPTPAQHRCLQHRTSPSRTSRRDHGPPRGRFCLSPSLFNGYKGLCTIMPPLPFQTSSISTAQPSHLEGHVSRRFHQPCRIYP